MPLYHFELHETIYTEWTVEAADEAEAERLVRKAHFAVDLDPSGLENLDVVKDGKVALDDLGSFSLPYVRTSNPIEENN